MCVRMSHSPENKLISMVLLITTIPGLGMPVLLITCYSVVYDSFPAPMILFVSIRHISTFRPFIGSYTNLSPGYIDSYTNLKLPTTF